ncbi:MAG: TspO/MBR family protein [Isosphaeraceae bacterium]
MSWIWKTRAGLAFTVAAALAACGVDNLLIAAASALVSEEIVRTPPGWEWADGVVGYVWVGLFVCMGLASWLAYRSGWPGAVRDGRLALSLLVVCMLYPVYTLGMRAIPGLVANVAVLALTCGVAALVRRSSATAAGLLAPIGLWLAVATLSMIQLVGLNFAAP